MKTKMKTKMNQIKKFYLQIRQSKTSPKGIHAKGYGIRAGYWPCLKAPYIQFSFHVWIIDFWHGLPSYKGYKTKWKS